MLAVATMASITQHVQYILLLLVLAVNSAQFTKLQASYSSCHFLCDPRGTFIMLCSSSLIPRLAWE